MAKQSQQITVEFGPIFSHLSEYCHAGLFSSFSIFFLKNKMNIKNMHVVNISKFEWLN